MDVVLLGRNAVPLEVDVEADVGQVPGDQREYDESGEAGQERQGLEGAARGVRRGGVGLLADAVAEVERERHAEQEQGQEAPVQDLRLGPDAAVVAFEVHRAPPSNSGPS